MYVTTIIGILYSIYIILVLTLAGWFTYALTSQKKFSLRFKVSIVSWIVFLSVLAVAFHVVTYLKLPWVRWEVLGKKLVPKKEIAIDVKDYKFHLPEIPVTVKVNEPVKFTVTSQDVTYGFGVFRTDGTLVFQMQVLPGHENEIVWIFHNTGKYTIRSTEYSGPENWKMVLRDAIVVK